MASAEAVESDDLPDPSKRRTLQRIGVGAGTVATLGAGGSRFVPRFSPVGRAAAVPPVVIAAGAVAATALLVGGMTYDDAKEPVDGLGPETLKQQVEDTLRKRASTLKSTLHDNRTIEDGLSHVTYTEGKIAAIEKLNEQATQQEVIDAAVAAGEEYGVSIQKNLMGSLQEAYREIHYQVDKVLNHSGLANGDVANLRDYFQTEAGGNYGPPDFDAYNGLVPRTVQLVDGSEYEYDSVDWDSSHGSYTRYLGPTTGSSASEWYTDGELEKIHFYPAAEVSRIWSSIETTLNDTLDGLRLWCQSVYGQIQSGEIEVSDVVTPREQAEMMSKDEGMAEALADLIALNIPVDLEREAHISITHNGNTSTIPGTIGLTVPPTGGLESGKTYNPADMEGSVFFTYDVSRGEADWTHYQTAVDGGVVTFTSEPIEGVTYKVNTIAGESATADASEFSAVSDADEWTVDLSDQLETAITEVDSVEMAASSGDTQYETVTLNSEFTIEKFVNSDGEEVDKAEFDQTEPQTDENYITKEEWEEMQRRNEELIKRWEEANEESENDDGGFDFENPFGGVFDGGASDLGVMMAYLGGGLFVLAAGVGAAFKAFNPLK